MQYRNDCIAAQDSVAAAMFTRVDDNTLDVTDPHLLAMLGRKCCHRDIIAPIAVSCECIRPDRDITRFALQASAIGFTARTCGGELRVPNGNRGLEGLCCGAW